MAYVQLPTTAGVMAFDHHAVERLLNRARFNSFLTAIFSFAVIVLCVASFIFEWWTLTTTNTITKFYVTGKISQCVSGTCSSVTMDQINTGSGSTAGVSSARIVSLIMTAINLLNGIFALLFAIGHSSYLSRLANSVPQVGARALQAPPGAFLERYHRQRRGPASLVTGGIIAAVVALAPYGALMSNWITAQPALVHDPAFQQRPGSAYFTQIVSAIAWIFVAFNIRRADVYFRSALAFQEAAVGPAVIITPVPVAGGFVQPGMPVPMAGGYAGMPVAQPGYAPYAPPQGGYPTAQGGYAVAPGGY